MNYNPLFSFPDISLIHDDVLHVEEEAVFREDDSSTLFSVNGGKTYKIGMNFVLVIFEYVVGEPKFLGVKVTSANRRRKI